MFSKIFSRVENKYVSLACAHRLEKIEQKQDQGVNALCKGILQEFTQIDITGETRDGLIILRDKYKDIGIYKSNSDKRMSDEEFSALCDTDEGMAELRDLFKIKMYNHADNFFIGTAATVKQLHDKLIKHTGVPGLFQTYHVTANNIHHRLIILEEITRAKAAESNDQELPITQTPSVITKTPTKRYGLFSSKSFSFNYTPPFIYNLKNTLDTSQDLIKQTIKKPSTLGAEFQAGFGQDPLEKSCKKLAGHIQQTHHLAAFIINDEELFDKIKKVAEIQTGQLESYRKEKDIPRLTGLAGRCSYFRLNLYNIYTTVNLIELSTEPDEIEKHRLKLEGKIGEINTILGTPNNEFTVDSDAQRNWNTQLYKH